MEEVKRILEMCIAQEERFVFEKFSRSDAMTLGKLIAEASWERYGAGIAVGVVINGLKVFQYVDEGASVHNAEWLDRKILTVTQLQKSSLRVWAEYSEKGITLEDEHLDPYDFALCGGGFPLTIKGVGVVGAFAASGLTDQEDHQVIIDALEKWTIASSDV